MARWMRWIILFCILFGLTGVGIAHAQTPLEFETVQVDLWPEYDRPEVLVIYRIALSSTASLPAKLSLRIPAAVGQPYNVANQDVDGMLYLLDYDLAQEGEWLRVTFTTPTPNLQMEFYDPSLTRDEQTRNFAFQWAADYKVNSMTVKVQKPFNATDFNILPQMGTARQEGDGLFYYTTLVGTVNVGTPVSLSFSYNKPDDQLSITPMPVQASTPIEADGTGGGFTQILPWILGGLGLVIIAAGGYWLWQASRKPNHPKPRRHRSELGEPHPQYEGGSGTIFCHQCGKKAGAGDAFCRACGTRLRTD